MKSSLSLARAALCAAVLTVLAGCGGGQRGREFVAARVLAFGDESSVIDPAGRKYTVNALQSDGASLDCAVNPIWVQTLATSFGLTFQECPGLVADAQSRILAVAGAKTEDLAGQIDAFLGEAQAFRAGDLVTVLIGQNDLLALYAGYDGSNRDLLIAQAEALATQVGPQVQRLTDAGAKVIVATVPDLGLTPFARGEGTVAMTLLTELTRRFNIRLLLGLENDGHKIGLVRSDDLVRQFVSFPTNNGYANFANVAAAACLTSAPLPTCTTATLTTDDSGIAANGATWLWADATHLSPVGQGALGSTAVTRARNNPF